MRVQSNKMPPKPESGADRLKKLWHSFVGLCIRRSVLPVVCVSTIFAIGLSYLLYTSFITPSNESNKAQLEVIAKVEKENEANREIERSEPQFKAEFKRVVKLYADSQPLLPSETEVANVLAQVQEAAMRNGVTLTGLNALKDAIKSPSSDKLYERELPAIVTGTHPQVVRFFYDVSRMPRIILIRDFSEISLRQRVSSSFTLMAYNSPPPAEIPALPAEFQKIIDEAKESQNE